MSLSISFDGNNDYAIFNSSTFPSGNSPFTVQGTFKWAGDGAAVNDVIFAYGRDNGAAGVPHLAVDGSAKIVATFGSGGAATSTSTVNPGTWYNAAMVYSGTQVKLFVNGVLEATTNFSSANIILDNGVNGNNGALGALFSGFGNVGSGSDRRYGTFNGEIRDVYVYDRALTDAEVAQNYHITHQNYNPIVTSGLVVNLDAGNRFSYSGSGSTWSDLSGNDNHFTLYNSPSFNGRDFTFNGSNQYAASANTLNLSSADAITLEIWSYTNPSSQCAILAEYGPNWNSTGGGFGIAPNCDGVGGLANMIHTNQNNLGPLNYNLTINNVWTCQTNVFSDTPDATGREVYGNGQLLNAAATFNQSAFPSETLYIGSRAGSAGFFIGQIGIVRVYNRKLSAAEVLQNFEATRARFGI